MTHRTRLRRLATVVAAVAAASVVLSGCLYAQIPTDESSASSDGTTSTGSDPVTDGVPDELLSFYSQQLEWGQCSNGFECSTVTAPLDWNDPEAGEIELAIARKPATGTAQGSLLTNPGGPGASGVNFLFDSADYIFGSDLQQNFDIVSWDPRGVGESTAVTCLDQSEMDSYLYDIPTAERGSDEWQSELDTKAEAFASACANNSGDLLQYITTEQSSRDLDLLRAVLGDEKLNYLGFSYGTFLGATYAKNFPDRVGRLVLDGAIDPSASGTDVSVGQAVGFENALRSYMQACIDGDTGAACPFQGTVDDGMSDLSALLAAVDASPLPSIDGRELGADALVTAIVATLYSEDSWSYLTQALTEVAQGETSTALYLADYYNGRNSDGSYADNSTEAFTAYNCMDYPAETDADEDAINALIAEQAPTIAPYWSGSDACQFWPDEPTGTREEITAAGADPILVVGTTGDPATPYEWAQALADQLASGVLLTYEGEGHTAYGGSSSCIDDAVETFLVDGTAPADGTTCQ